MIIAVVGAGGKTTVGRKMAYELSLMGCRTLFTTSTKIYRPDDGSVYIGPAEDIAAADAFLTAASAFLPNGKLLGYTPNELKQLPPLFDYIIVEADGSKGKPVKAPNDTEPVYPLNTDVVVGVIGLDCLGKPMTDEFVHRPALFANISGAEPGDMISAQHLLRLIKHPNGLFKNKPQEARKIVFLNKSDMIDETVRNAVHAVVGECPFPVLLTGREIDWFTAFNEWITEGKV